MKNEETIEQFLMRRSQHMAGIIGSLEASLSIIAGRLDSGYKSSPEDLKKFIEESLQESKSQWEKMRQGKEAA